MLSYIPNIILIAERFQKVYEKDKNKRLIKYERVGVWNYVTPRYVISLITSTSTNDLVTNSERIWKTWNFLSIHANTNDLVTNSEEFEKLGLYMQL